MLNSLAILHSSLTAIQKAIDVRNRNISEANNPNYVKEDPIMATLPPPGGVSVSNVRRAADEALKEQVNLSYSRYNGFNEEYNTINEIVTYFDETSSSNLKGFIDSYYQSVLDFLKDTSNQAAIENVLTKAQTLISEMQYRYNVLGQIQEKLKGSINETVKQINTLAQQLAEVNKEILYYYNQTRTTDKDYKMLLDKRDELLNELSKYVPLKTRYDDIGRVEVLLSNSQSVASGYIVLVDTNGKSRELEYSDSDNSIEVEGVVWEEPTRRFFTEGILGAYFNAYYRIEDYKEQLNDLAKYLINNSLLQGANNGTGVSVFAGNDITDITVNITSNDLENYNNNYSETDQDYFSSAWDKTLNGDSSQSFDGYIYLTSKISNDLTQLKIKRDVEYDLYSSLKTKYTEKVGVNIDMELAEIMKLQQQYEAVSKMIGTSSKLLDFLLNTI